MVGLDDGPAQGEPDTHAFLFGGEKGLEKPVSGFAIEAHARILDTYMCIVASHLCAHE
jgi:hypothetical protein